METRLGSRSVVLTIRLTPAEKLELEKATRKDKRARSLSDFVRDRALEQARAKD
jgi:uncharacterized protein (DUF1778 family)